MTENQNQLTVIPSASVQKAPILIEERGIKLSSLEDLWRFSGYVVAAKLAPKGLETHEAVFITIQMGLEIGITPMVALQNTGVINGKAGIYGDLPLGLVRGTGLLEAFEETQTDDNIDPMFRVMCLTEDKDERKKLRIEIAKFQSKINPMAEDFGSTCFLKRKGGNESFYRFTVRDAKRAGLWGKPGPWSQYPQRQLMFRARQFHLRDQFPDVLKGVKTVDELRDYPEQIEQPKAILDVPKVIAEVSTPAATLPGAGVDIRKEFMDAAKAKGHTIGSIETWVRSQRPTMPAEWDLTKMLVEIHGKTLRALIPKIPPIGMPEIQEPKLDAQVAVEKGLSPFVALSALCADSGFTLSNFLNFAVGQSMVSDEVTDINQVPENVIAAFVADWAKILPEFKLAMQ